MPHAIDWNATLTKWKTAVTTFRLNLSEISREAGTTRQHVTSILAGRSVPSVIIAERIDRAVEVSVERRKSFAKKIIEESAGIE